MRLEPGIWAKTIEIFRGCGKNRRECVAYWLGDPGGDLVSKVVHPEHSATAGHYELDPRWLNDFWDDLARRKRSVLAQVHTHGGVAFHSSTDDRWPLIHTAGFLSLVVPDFAMGDAPKLFLAELAPDGRFLEVPVSTIEGLP